MNKDFVVFDFDGTIADTLGISVGIINNYIKWTGLNIKLSNVRNYQAGLRTPNIFIRFIRYPFWMLFHFILGTLQKKLHSKVDQVKPFDGLVQIIKDLKKSGVSLGIVTNNIEPTVVDFLKNNKIHDSFDFIYSSKLVFAKSFALKKVMNDYNFSNRQFVYVGDEVRDIIACQDAGVDIISVSWGFDIKEHLQDHNPKFLVDNKDELKDVFKKLKLL